MGMGKGLSFTLPLPYSVDFRTLKPPSTHTTRLDLLADKEQKWGILNLPFHSWTRKWVGLLMTGCQLVASD